METYAHAFDRRNPFVIEYRLRRKDGVYRWILDTGVPRFGHDGLFAGYIGSCVDITDRREAELSLRESEERFRQLADNIDEAFWMTDPAGKMLYERIFGRPVPEIYDAPASWMECILPEDRGRVREAALTRQTSGEYHEEYRIRLPDNSIRWILDRAFRSATRQETCIGLSAWLKT
jgi:PAS domain S-box-containing protein